MLASRRSANEGSAISSLRTYHGAQVTYQATTGAGEFAGDVDAANASPFTVLASVNLIEPVLGSGVKSGYNFVGGRKAKNGTTQPQFTGWCAPTIDSGVARTGTRQFSVITDGVIHYSTTGTVINMGNSQLVIESSQPLK